MLKIFTLNWNGLDKLKLLYPSLINCLNNIDYEWYVKDNNSSDESVEYLKSNNVNVIGYPDNNSNFAEGMNFLFKESNAKDDDLILLLNNDIIFNDTTSILNMIKMIGQDDVGVVGARLLFTNTNLIQHCGVVFKDGVNPIHLRYGKESSCYDFMNREFQCVTGAVWLTRTKYYENICRTNNSGNHGLNERYSWGFEDVDASLHIKYEQKKKIVYCGRTNIFHENNGTLKYTNAHIKNWAINYPILVSKWMHYCISDEAMYENIEYNLI